MKQYTTQKQTAKLIELGFERPKFEIETQLCNIKGKPLRVATIVGDYSIGELIEMLPTIINTDVGYALSIYHNRAEWEVSYDDNGIYHPIYSTEKDELVDALYDMIVKLKEEGVI